MDEEVLNASLRKFLRTVGVTGQRAIEEAIRDAMADGRLKGHETLDAAVRLTVPEAGLDILIEGAITLG